MTVSIAIKIFGARRSPGMPGIRIDESLHQSYNGGNQKISDNGGRTMVPFASY